MSDLLVQLAQLAEVSTQEDFDALFAKLPKSALDEIERDLLRREVQKPCSLTGFKAWYQLKYGFKLPPHMEVAVNKAWEAHERGVPFVLFGARGFWKTITFITLDEYLIGQFPNMSGVITGANDGNCNIISKNIASTIEYHPEWKQCFPHVVPMEKAWGADGYYVRDNRMTVEEWKQKQAGRIDPTFVGGGYSSSTINGKHPDLFLHVDDLHDIDSWKSETERRNIKEVYKGQIAKTVIRKDDKLLTWVNMLGVPFAKDDTLYEVMLNEPCVSHVIPAMTRAAEGEGVYIDGANLKTGAVYDDIKGWWYLTYPEHFGINSVLAARSEGKFAFWQMYMMDIDTAKTQGLRYYLYEHEKIPENIPMAGGADPTTFDDEGKSPTHSHFAHAYLGKLPNGTAVVVDGFLEQCGLTEAKDAIISAQNRFPGWRMTKVEDVSVGKVFAKYLRTDPKVKVIGNLPNEKGSVRSKVERQKHEVSPWLESATLLISNKDTKFLRALRKLYDEFYEMTQKPHFEGWDAADGVYEAMKMFPEIWRVPDVGSEIPTPQQQQASNPWHLENAWSHV